MSDIVYCPPNVDCPCYAKLLAEVERLRAALREIAELKTYSEVSTAIKAAAIARAALGESDD